MRKYAGEQEVIWGGDPKCQHNWEEVIQQRPNASGGHDSGKLQIKGLDNFQESVDYHNRVSQSQFCSVCGAWRGASGNEPTPEMYCAHLVEIFREIRRVLRKDGTFFLNIGDSYAGGGRGIGYGGKQDTNRGCWGMPKSIIPAGLKAKDLCGIPWRIAFALQEDGWFLRSAIVWEKENPMPESVNGWRWEQHRIKDKKTREWHDCPGCKACAPNDGLILRKGSWRPTKSYEFIFMFSKSEVYYSDAEAVREPFADATLPRYLRGVSDNHKWLHGADGQTQHTMAKPRQNIRKQFEESMGGAGTSFQGHSGYLKADGALLFNPAGRNLRDVWTFPTTSFAGSHFAVFPENLPETCIKAATSPKVCPYCGASWARIVQKGSLIEQRNRRGKDPHLTPQGYIREDKSRCGINESINTLGWKPTCRCEGNDGSARALVLDPFAGSGTTLAVAAKLGRDYLGIEISKEYEPLIQARLAEAEHGLSPKDQELGQKPLF